MTTIDGFADVSVFVAVAEAGDFSAAARLLGVSRSAVAKAVARLEIRLGVRLFHRTTRRHSLTLEGQMFQERCQRAVAELQAGREMLDAGRTAVIGKLRVSMPVLFGRLCVAPALLRLAVGHPALQLDLSFSDRHVDLVEDGFDLSVRMGPLGSGSGLMTRRIAHERTIVVAAPAYLARHGIPSALDDLQHHHAVTYARGGLRQVWRFPRAGTTLVDVTPPTRMRLDDIGAIADAAADGFGLAWLPDWLIRDRLHAGTLVPVLNQELPLVSDVHLVWPETHHLPTRVRVAIDVLVVEARSLGET